MSNTTFGARLLDERQRLGLNQTEFGAIGGATSLAQHNYENDKQRPGTDYLAGIANAGADISYIVTGEVRGALTVDEIRSAHSLLSMLAQATAAPHEPSLVLERLRQYDLAPQVRCQHCWSHPTPPWLIGLTRTLERLASSNATLPRAACLGSKRPASSHLQVAGDE